MLKLWTASSRALLLGLTLVTAFATALVAASGSAAQADPADEPGTKDPALFTRMPGFHIYRGEVLEFDQLEFEVGPDKKQTLEGRRSMVVYYANEGITLPSGLQIVRNYASAIKAIGGTQVYAFEDGGIEIVVLRATVNGAELWARVNAGGNGMYTVQILEKQAMAQDVVASAAALAGSLRQTGRAVVPGIFFDTNKAVMKPESGPAIKELVKLLSSDAKLKVHVVGHTDNVGAFEANLKLSKERAEAVVRELTSKHKVAAARLRPSGVGPLAPTAPNLDEAGRARNRRVEVVAQ